ncbi:MAG: PilZ domain-containing protein [Myxococcota bacterium]
MDRRKYHRIGTDQVISFAPMGRANRDRLAVSKNLSTGGIRFEAVGCDIDLDEVLRITFNLGEQTVEAVGRVVWAVDTDPITTEFGIQFMEIDPQALALLEEVVTEEPAA